MSLIKRILFIEDDHRTIKLIKHALQLPSEGDEVFFITDGEEALAYLGAIGAYKDYPLQKPDMIVLDLRLPTIDGLEVLKEIRKMDKLDHTPVNIFSTSTQSAEVTNCYKAGASSFIVKPVRFDDFSHAVQVLVNFWSIVRNG